METTIQPYSTLSDNAEEGEKSAWSKLLNGGESTALHSSNVTCVFRSHCRRFLGVHDAQHIRIDRIGSLHLAAGQVSSIPQVSLLD